MKKPFYKRWWFIVLVVFVVIAAIGGGGDDEPEQISQSKPAPSKVVETTKVVEKKEVTPVKTEPSVPREFTAALTKAKIYSDTMSMSKAAIYDQLVSEYGENFPADAAQYAIDNVKANWNENAAKKARIYADSMSMSNSAVYDQLVSEYGEQFTPSQAQYGVDSLK